jgi:hypothetical protein
MGLEENGRDVERITLSLDSTKSVRLASTLRNSKRLKQVLVFKTDVHKYTSLQMKYMHYYWQSKQVKKKYREFV